MRNPRNGGVDFKHKSRRLYAGLEYYYGKDEKTKKWKMKEAAS